MSPRRCLFSPVRVIAKNEETLGERVWKEYGKAVERRDLKKALKILEAVQVLENPRDNFRFVTDIQEEQEGQEEQEEEDKEASKYPSIDKTSNKDYNFEVPRD